MDMSDIIPTDVIILHKKNGERHSLTAFVNESEIRTYDVSVEYEEGDFFVRIINGSEEFYKVKESNFVKGKHGIPDYYLVKVEKRSEITDMKTSSKKKMIFISHSYNDKYYTKAFVELLFSIGLKEDDIVCSSYQGVGVPLRANIYDWLVEKFQECDLHVIFFLSHNYYKSVASLNEMGAAWAMKQTWDGILLPGFSFSEVDGCISGRQIAIKLDSDINELKHRLGELKDDIVAEFYLPGIKATRWETIRDTFIEEVKKIPVVE